MSGTDILPSYIPAGSREAFASLRAYEEGAPPVARILTRAKVNTAWGRPTSFQLRAVTPDGAYWSGRSSGGGPIVTLRRVIAGTPLHRYLVEYHPANRAAWDALRSANA